MARFESPTAYTGQQATESKWGTVKFATSLEAVNPNIKNMALSPSSLQNSVFTAEGRLQWADVTMTAAQVRALATTPITLVPAQGAGTVVKFVSAQLKLDYGGTNAFTEAGDNLGIKYTNASGVQVSQTVETTAFITATADTYTNAEPAIDVIVAATGAENQALVLDNLGSNFGGNAANDNLLVVRTYYLVHTI